MISDHRYSDDAGVQVTSASFNCAGQTLAMGSVTAVSALRHGLTRFQKLLLTCGLLLLLLAHPASLRVTGVLMVAHAAWFLLRPPYSVMVTSASGHHTLLTDQRRLRIFAIVRAINEAIAGRA